MAALVRTVRRPALVLSPDDDAAAAARAVLRFHLRGFAREEAGARAGEVEPIHQLRVATRRVRAALRLFAPLLGVRIVEHGRREMGWLADAIGTVRDLDVLAEAVTASANRLDPEVRRALGPLAVEIHDRRAAAQAALVETLDSARARRLLDRIATFAETTPPGRRDVRLGDVASELVRPLLRAVVRAGRRLGTDAPPAAAHRLRIRAKRLRYALETLHALGGKDTRKLVRRLTRLQDVLGIQQDAVTQVTWLRAWALRPETSPPTVLATGALMQAIARRGQRRRRRVPDVWRSVDRPKLHQGMLAELGGKGGRGAADHRATGT
jgi:CHAD domain-containing protein